VVTFWAPLFLKNPRLRDYSTTVVNGIVQVGNDFTPEGNNFITVEVIFFLLCNIND
jgi:hypothetical protein